MDHGIIERLHISKSMIIKKVYASIAILLVSALLLSTVSFAWLTLSLAPETSDITTTLGANGNLEMALATSEHLALLEANNMYDDDTRFEFTTGDVVHDNVLWGNLIDLNAIDYGLHVLKMRPAVLNIQDGCIADAPISVGKYGSDGRLDNFNAENIDLGIVGFSSVYDTDKAQYYAGSISMSIDDLKSGNYDKENLVQTILENKEYGVRIAGLLDYSATADLNQNSANIDLLVDGYCFAVDLLFRTNAPTGNLMLQTEGAQRMESDLEEEYVGGGSFIDMNNPKLSAAMKVVFANTLTGEIYALAQADAEGKLWITARADENGNLVPTESDDAALIKPLTQNQVSAITAWVFVDGNQVDNSAASTKEATAMKLNLQFSTDAVLNPAYTDKNTNPNHPNRPDMTDIPDIPDVPEIPADAVYYFSNDGEGAFTIYTLAENGSRDYELPFTGVVDKSTNTVTLNHVSEYPTHGVVVPALVVLEGSETEYAVQVAPFRRPFADLGTENAVVSFAQVDGKKVGISSVKLSDLFYHYDTGTDFVSINLSGLDTSTATDMSHMFSGCSNLTSLNLSGMDTSQVTNMECMFAGCTSLSSLDLNEFDTSNVTNMRAMFMTCPSLTSLDVSGFDTSNVTNMHAMFNYCTSLTSLDLSGLDTSNVTDMSWMFTDCSGLVSLDVSGFNTSNVTNMTSMFWNCSSLTELDLSGLDTSNVTDMSYMFTECVNLISLDVSGFVTSNVTNMRYMFRDSVHITKLDVSSFDTSNVTDMAAMFDNCSSLTALDLSGFVTSNVTDMSHMFYLCRGLTKLDLSGFVTSNVTDMAGMFAYCHGLMSIDLSGFDTAIAEDTSEMFYECARLQRIVTPKAMGNASIALPDVYVCEANGNTYTVINKNVPAQAILKKDVASLAVVDTGDVTDDITWTLYDNGLLKFAGTGAMANYASTDDIPWYGYRENITAVEITDGITYLGQANLAWIDYGQITIPESVVGIAEHNGWGGQRKTVYYAGSERQWDAIAIYDANVNASNNTLISGTIITTKSNAAMLYSGNIISSDISWVIYEDGILVVDGSGEMPEWSETNVPPWANYSDEISAVMIAGSVDNIGAYAFANMPYLQSVKIGASVNNIGSYAFSKCTNLIAVAFDKDSALQQIEAFCFDDCSSLRYMHLPDSVTSLGEAAFEACTALDYVVMNGVTSMGECVFFCCESLLSIDFAEGLEVIPYATFARCFKLTSVSIPSTVTRIELHAFLAEHNDLFTVYYAGSREQWEAIVIEEGNTYFDNAEYHFSEAS